MSKVAPLGTVPLKMTHFPTPETPPWSPGWGYSSGLQPCQEAFQHLGQVIQASGDLGTNRMNHTLVLLRPKARFQLKGPCTSLCEGLGWA